jgi:hypothetical protein
MIDQVSDIIIGLQLVPVVFPCNGKHEIAYHRETYDEKHITNILQKENSKNTIKDKGQLNTKVQAIYINKTSKDGIKYKIAKQRSKVLVK